MNRSALIAAALTALAMPALAADFAHPKAVNIAIQGVGPAQVCYYTGPVGPSSSSTWVCDTFDLAGARNPEYITLPAAGPVVIRGAKWAFLVPALGELIPLVPAQ
jgi:hypothetical protein